MSWVCSACGGDNPEGTRFCGHCGAAHAEDPAREATVADALKSFVSAQVAEKIVGAGGEVREERRLVTALFADLSGFTPLADRLDPEQLLEVIDPIIESMTNIVGRYEGYVDKFAGDALLAFFGAPVAHEDDAHRALMVATEMHHELAELAKKLPPEAGELTLHIGVNSGRVVARVLGTDVRMDYTVLGDAVILAQRLESAAPAGETYVGEETYQLTRDRFEFESVGELTLKGKAETVPAWRLIGEIRRTRGLARMVGRDTELQ
ncbi:MAG TPA: adenylate/guanylate cyclase domain-containing protein, partial [Actinomycetota bacterium]|nr:adenylate/guanylate cyclase domain-containing protein [Actinomycetota bacterium]